MRWRAQPWAESSPPSATRCSSAAWRQHPSLDITHIATMWTRWALGAVPCGCWAAGRKQQASAAAPAPRALRWSRVCLPACCSTFLCCVPSSPCRTALSCACLPVALPAHRQVDRMVSETEAKPENAFAGSSVRLGAPGGEVARPAASLAPSLATACLRVATRNPAHRLFLRMRRGLQSRALQRHAGRPPARRAQPAGPHPPAATSPRRCGCR